jgi:outer membrane protein
MISRTLRLAIALAGVSYGQSTLHLSLQEAEKIAVANNPRIAASKFTAAAAGEVPKELHSNMQPTLVGSITGVGADSGSRLAAGGLNNPVVYNRLGSGLSVSQLITDFGRTGNLVESARLRAKAEDQATQSTRAEILLATDRAYFGVLRAQALLKVAEQTVANRQLVAEQVRALAEAKLRSTLDVSFANVNLAEAQLQLAGAQNDVNAALAELATAMGIPGQQAFVLEEEPMPELLPDAVQPLIQQALRDRPELAGIRLQQSAAERFAAAERALSRPSIGLVASAGFVPAGQDAIPGKYGALGVNVTLPVFNGGLFKARRSEAELRSQAVNENVKNLENLIARDVRVAFLNAMTADARMNLSNEFLKQAQLSLDLAQTRYDLGLSSIVELGQAQLNLTSAQIASARARYDYQAQRAVLNFQTGTLK